MKTTPEERESALRWVGANITPRYEKATVFDAFDDLAEAERELATADERWAIGVQHSRQLGEALVALSEEQQRAERAEEKLEAAEARAERAEAALLELQSSAKEFMADSDALIGRLRGLLERASSYVIASAWSSDRDNLLAEIDKALAAPAVEPVPAAPCSSCGGGR